ncbi:MAG: hypothetical protein IKH27_14255, partial [Oscillospiraceae bacterium]|nr:hypothetical protein [Oscillospiraceae bacterium]
MKKLISALSSLCLAATSLLGAFPAITAENAIEAKAADKIVYNLIPSGKEYKSAETTGKKNNEYTATPGEELTIDWTIKGDPGTAGIQMNFDFTQVEYVGKKRGGAYRITPTFSDYENTAELKKGECIYAWAQSEESVAEDNKVIYSFNIKTPQANGTYTVGLGTLDENKVIPIDQTKTIPFDFYGLDITVEGGSEPVATAAPPADGTIIYNLVPSGKTYTSAETSGKKYNVYEATGGEALTIDWTIKNDQGTAGIQMNFDFTQVEYTGVKRGGAYRIAPTFSDYNNSPKLAKGECVYAWAKHETEQAADGAVIYSFNVNVPNAKGTYRVGLSTKDENKVIPVDQTQQHKYEFYGLEIVVADGPTATQAPPDASTIIYNLVPNGKSYESAQENGLKNNIYKATAGEELQIDWTIKNDQGTAGLQMNFDFTQVEYVSGKRGGAYRITPTYSDYKSTPNLKQGECIYTWAQSEENKATDGATIYSFNVKVPSADGTYSVGMAAPTADTANKAVPIDQTKEHKIVFYGLDIVVGDNPNPSTTPEPISSNKLTYDLVPKGIDYTAASSANGKNSVTVKPGTELTIEWYVKNDQGTAGLQMYLDFTKVDYQKGNRGGAYRITPTYSDYASAPGKLQKGEVVYTWAQSEASQADESKPIYTFNVKVPETEGSYTVGLDRSQENKAVPVDQDHPYSFDFHDLEIVVSAQDVTTSAEPIVTTTAVTSDNLDITTAAKPTETEPIATTTKKVVEPAGKAQWSIGEVTVGAGAPAKVPVKVTNDDGTSGFVVNFKYDGLTFEGISWADGYTGEATINNDKQVVVWANGSGANENADGVIMYLNFIAPQTAGEYPVSFDKLEITNTEGQPIEATMQNGKVIVDGTIVVGSTNWTIGTKTAAPGATVKVPVTVTEDSGTAGFVVQYDYDSKLKFDGIEWANGYEGDATLNDNKLVAVWASSKGSNETANDVVMYLNFTAPAEEGTYDVKFTSLEVSDTAQQLLNVTKKDGAVIVNKNIQPAGKTNWVIGKETVAPGASAKVPVTVTGDEGTAGFVVMFKADSALKFDGFEWADGYTGSATLNDDQMAVVWANDKGADEKADGVVLYMNFTAPTTEGEYPVEFTLMDITNTDQQQLTVTKENGYVKVNPIVTTVITTPGTTTVTSTTLPQGKTGWYIGKKEAEPGKTVKVPVTVKGDTGTAGFVAQFAYDPKLTFIGYEWGDAYSDNAELNKDEMVIVWAAGPGNNEIAADDAVVVNLVFTAPDEEGTYPVTFTDLEVVDTEQNPLDYVKYDGAVIVTKTPTTTVETGTETTASDTEIPGSETTVSETEIPGSETTVSETEIPGSETTASETEIPGSETTVSETEIPGSETTVSETEIPGSETTVSETDIPGSETTVSETDIPGSETTASETEIPGSETTASETEIPGSETTASETEIPGSETTASETEIPGSETTASETEIPGSETTASGTGDNPFTTTTEPIMTTAPVPPIDNPGHVVYQIADVNADAGKIARVPVYVWYDEGTTGFKMQFAVPDGFKVEGLIYGDAYTSDSNEYTWNGKDYVLVWAASLGAAQKAADGAVIATLLISVPDDAEGKYPVTFVKNFTDVSGENEKEVEFTEIDGSITVAKKQTGEQGNIVFNVGDAVGKPGDQVSVPLTVWFDDGAAEFELTLDVPDGFTIDDIAFNPEYEQNGKFTWDPDTKTLKWVRNPDSTFVPTPGTEIATIKTTIPADAEPGTEYPIGISSATAKDKDGNPMKTTANAGTIHVADIPPVTTIGSEVNPGDVTTVSGTEENPGDVTTVSGTEENPGDVTTVSGTEENPGDVTTVSGTEENPGD